MAVNKVVYGDDTLMDITDTTATDDIVVKGETFYDASGQKRVGTFDDYLPKSKGGIVNGNVTIDTGTTEPKLSVKRTVSSIPCELIMSVDSTSVGVIRFTKSGSTINNIYLRPNDIRFSKPLAVESGGVPQNGAVGQVLIKGPSGARWVDLPTQSAISVDYINGLFE